MQINQKLVPSGRRNHPNRPIRSVSYITIHTTGNRSPGATARAHARYQYNGSGGRQASWHYTVDDAEIWQSFRNNQMCWHTGTTRGNENSLGIEICVNNQSAFLRGCMHAAWLTAKLMEEFSLGLDKVVQHHFWSGKNCPAELRGNSWPVNWTEFMNLVHEFGTGRQPENAPGAEQFDDPAIQALKETGILFEPRHWYEALNGGRETRPEYFKILTGRIIDARWREYSPEDLRAVLTALL